MRDAGWQAVEAELGGACVVDREGEALCLGVLFSHTFSFTLFTHETRWRESRPRARAREHASARLGHNDGRARDRS